VIGRERTKEHVDWRAMAARLGERRCTDRLGVDLELLLGEIT
jgi:hypothetical protein